MRVPGTTRTCLGTGLDIPPVDTIFFLSRVNLVGKLNEVWADARTGKLKEYWAYGVAADEEAEVELADCVGKLS